MKIAVLGGGLLGVATAYYLVRDGHAVTVFDRQPGVARETSFANGGQLSADSAGPWMSPSMPLKTIKWLLSRDAPLVARLRLDPALFGWLARAARNCTPSRYAHNLTSSLRIARYSRDCLRQLAEDTGVAFDVNGNGILHVFRNRKDLDAFAAGTPRMEGCGVRLRVLDRAGCIEHEPALAQAQAPLAGGVFFPEDGAGDCHKLTEAVAELAAGGGCEFRFSESVTGLATRGERIDGVLTDRGRHGVDAVVVALGSESPRLLRSLDLRLPVYPVKGYTVTLPATGRNAPRVSLTDESNKVVISRLGARIRAAGTADLAGFDRRVDPRRCERVVRDLEDWYPGCGERARMQSWACLRPMSPDCLPVLGATPRPNLFLNTGHGSLGWTMGCGSARAVADVIAGRAPGIDIGAFSVARFG